MSKKATTSKRADYKEIDKKDQKKFMLYLGIITILLLLVAYLFYNSQS